MPRFSLSPHIFRSPAFLVLVQLNWNQLQAFRLEFSYATESVCYSECCFSVNNPYREVAWYSKLSHGQYVQIALNCIISWNTARTLKAHLPYLIPQ